jgi:hypothetical protein
MRLTESDFNANLLPALQTLHTKLTRDEIEFDSAKEALIEYVKRWTLNPAIRADLVNEIRKQTQNSNELISKVEEILMIFGGVQALGAVAEDKMKHEHIDALLKKISEGISQIGEENPEDRDPDSSKQLALHVMAMKDDVHFRDHPEWEEIVKDAEQVLKEKGVKYVGSAVPYHEVSTRQGSGDEQEDLYTRMVAKAKEQFGSEADDFDIEAAIYWLASDYHGGQTSELYSILSTSNFKPGASHSSVADEGGMAEEIYDMLVREFAREIK